MSEELKSYELLKVWATLPKTWDIYEGVAVSVSESFDLVAMSSDLNELLEMLNGHRSKVNPDGDFVKVTEYAVFEVFDGEIVNCIAVSKF